MNQTERRGVFEQLPASGGKKCANSDANGIIHPEKGCCVGSALRKADFGGGDGMRSLDCGTC